MQKNELIKKFENEICSRCECNEAECSKGITIFTETNIVCNEIKTCVCAKCIDYRGKVCK